MSSYHVSAPFPSYYIVMCPDYTYLPFSPFLLIRFFFMFHFLKGILILHDGLKSDL